jgi:hypothetical protein
MKTKNTTQNQTCLTGSTTLLPRRFAILRASSQMLVKRRLGVFGSSFRRTAWIWEDPRVRSSSGSKSSGIARRQQCLLDLLLQPHAIFDDLIRLCRAALEVVTSLIATERGEHNQAQALKSVVRSVASIRDQLLDRAE